MKRSELTCQQEVFQRIVWCTEGHCHSSWHPLKLSMQKRSLLARMGSTSFSEQQLLIENFWLLQLQKKVEIL
uniref:Uncharacterized protein n=1 Tax=Rhizophora mucronata TaxID=61149 RepID=A0A2P2KS16_RHIMU